MTNIINVKVPKTKHKSVLSNKGLIFILVASLVVIATVIVVYFLTRPKEQVATVPNTSEISARIEKIETTDKASKEVSLNAQVLADADDVVGVENVYNQAIESAGDDNAVKASLYMKLALSLVPLKQDAKVLAAAQESYRLDSEGLFSATLLPLIGHTAAALGKKDLALEYLRKYYDMQKNNPYRETGVLEDLERSIAELEKS